MKKKRKGSKKVAKVAKVVSKKAIAKEVETPKVVDVVEKVPKFWCQFPITIEEKQNIGAFLLNNGIKNQASLAKLAIDAYMSATPKKKK